MREWRPVIGLEDRYEVSNDGLVRTKPRILKPWRIPTGHLAISLGSRKRTYVHRLVAEAFLGNPEGKPMVNHKNSNPTDNAVENLEWATASENLAHGWRENPKAHYADVGVLAFNEDGLVVAEFDSMSKAAKYYCVTKSAVAQAVRKGSRCAKLFWRRR